MHPCLTVIDHPLVAHKLSIMREKGTSSARFRALAKEIGLLIGYELTRDLKTETRDIETPIAPAQGRYIKGKKLVLVPILRAALGLLEGLQELLPSARIGHIGLYREPETMTAVEYFLKVPDDVAERPVIIVGAMLASGNSAIAAIGRLKERGATHIKFACLIAAPEGLAALAAAHPDVPVYTAAVDQGLDGEGYIVPGLGDAGDRMFGTK